MYRIKQLREDKKLSQRALAQKIGVSAKAVNFWESGRVDPSAHSISLLADEFGCTCDYLLGREDDFGNVNVMKELTETERSWLELLHRLSDRRQSQALDYIRNLIEKDN